MFQPSAFAVPVGSFQQPVNPPAVDADAPQLVYVGLNCDWLPYITGALTQLLLQSTWIVSDPAQLQLVQDRVFNLIALFNCKELPTLEQLCGSTVAGGDMGCCCIRFENGKFQTLDCGVWTDIPGQPDAGFGPINGQPGAGAPQPIPGECREFAATLPASGSYMVPVPLNTGDTVEISNVDGATNDNTITWWLQDGQIYFAGEAQGPIVFVPGDPVTAPHASIIGSWDGGTTFFGVGTSLFTVPGGISNGTLTLWVNFPMNIPRYGQYTFLVSVCNNQTPPWCRTRDFLVGTGPWGQYSDGLFTNVGTWTNAQGWVGEQDAAAGFFYVLAATEMTLPGSFDLTSIDMTFDLVPGHNDSAGNPGIQIFVDNTAVASIAWNAETSGTTQHLTWTGTLTATTNIKLFLGISNVNGGPYDGGSGAITSVEVCGTGVPLSV
jgi:hypothetical protein